MADLIIDTKVVGAEKIADLEKQIAKLNKQLEDTNNHIKNTSKEMENMSTKSVALGNIAAEAFEQVVQTMQELLRAGTEYQEQLDAIEGKTAKVSENTEKMNLSMGQLGAAIFNVKEETSAYNTVLKALDGLYLNITSFITGRSIPALIEEQDRIEEEAKAKEKMTAIMKEMEKQQKLNAKAMKEEARATDQANAALARYNGQQAAKVKAHEEQIAILYEMVNVYEEQGRSTDKLLDKIEKLEATDALHVKTIREKAEEQAKLNEKTREASEVTDDYTESVDSNTESLNNNISTSQKAASSTGTSGTAVVSSWDSIQSDTKYAYQLRSQGYTNQSDRLLRQIEQRLADLYRVNHDTNNAIRGD